MNNQSNSQSPTTTEAVLLKIWQEMFGFDDITVNTDFFDIGGNSLNAIKFLARVDNAFGEGLLLPDTLFEDGRLSSLAAAIDHLKVTSNG